MLVRSTLIVFLTVAPLAWPAMSDAIFRESHIFRPVTGHSGAVAVAERHAGEAGLEMLRMDGNAVDAAVSVGFTLAVTLPRAGNLGGGGFMLIHDAKTGISHALDYREVAPMAADRDMFLDASGEADPRLSRESALSVGVPGTVAGLLAAHERFGSLPLEVVMAPAIRLASEGFVVEPGLARQLRMAIDLERLDEEAQAVYFGNDAIPPKAGERLFQPDLAASLQRILLSGRDGFYSGLTAEAIVATVQQAGGRITLEDLAAYQPVWREPVRGSYRGHEIVSMPPPSSGGIHLIQMLQLLENFPLASWGQNSAQATHIMTEVMKRAYADRSEYLGDPDFVEVPQKKLLSEEYEQLILRRINSMTPTASADIRPGPLDGIPEPTETTHFSIIDRHGNAVANTYTLNFSFGSGIMAEGTGILLNNEMDDFSAKPGVANAYGLIGGDANAVAPGKRPLSSMTPTLVLHDGEIAMATGSPGGSRIITTVLQVVVNALDFGMNAAEANHTPRFHHQWLPDRFEAEAGFPSESIRALRLMGYEVEISKVLGAAHTVMRDPDGTLSAAADPRRDGASALAY